MLVLTEAAAEVVKSVTDTPQAPDGTGLRITQSAEEPGAANGLELAAAAEPGPRRPGRRDLGRTRFLDPLAAAYLDDKVLDAEVDAQGKVRFLLGRRPRRSTNNPSPRRHAPGGQVVARAGRRLGWKGDRESVLDDALGFSNGLAVPFSRRLSVLSDKIGTYDGPVWCSGMCLTGSRR